MINSFLNYGKCVYFKEKNPTYQLQYPLIPLVAGVPQVIKPWSGRYSQPERSGGQMTSLTTC